MPLHEPARESSPGSDHPLPRSDPQPPGENPAVGTAAGGGLDSAFEPGFEPVLEITSEDDRGQLSVARLGARGAIVRLELGEDHALEFDGEGRLIHSQIAGRIERRTLDNRLFSLQVVGTGRARRLRRVDPPEDPLQKLLGFHQSARRLLQRVEKGARLSWLRKERGETADPLEWARRQLVPCARWDREALERDVRQLRRIYRPIPILPPDQYQALVFQATEGCGYNRCSFCSFYRGIDYRVRTLEEFEAHLDAVLRFLGRSALRHHRVFLGQANALLIDHDQLLCMLERITKRLPLLSRDLAVSERDPWRQEHPQWIDGVYSFIDGFHRPKPVEQLQALAESGVRRVYLGLESGSDEVLRLLQKPPQRQAAIQLARNLRAAGIGLGVILLIGAGGHREAERHVRKSLDAVGAMELGKGDQIYLSRLVVEEGSPYAQRAAELQIEALDPSQLQDQEERLRIGLRELLGAGVPIASYDIRLSKQLLPGG